jgi:hypothetical protein
MKLTQILAGRREAALLDCPSVYRMVEILAWRCRDESWVRSAVASLARFSALTGWTDLEGLRERALAEPGIADQELTVFADALAGYAASQVATLAMGAKLWFRLNDIAVSWRPLPGRAVAAAPVTEQMGVESVILLALSSSGLSLADLLRLRVGDLGSLDVDGRLLPDIEADPLAVQYSPCRSKQGDRLTFLSYQARQTLLHWLAPARSSGKSLDPKRLLLACPDGSPVSRAIIERAMLRGRAVIQVGNNANVELCRATGDFFRRWGMPGSRFSGPEELSGEEFF